MTRRAVALDRVVALLAGGALVALGCLAIAWQQGVFGRSAVLHTGLADDVGSSWWPWATAGVGVVLVGCGLRWLAAHRWPRKASRIELPGTGLTADASSVAEAAGSALGGEPAVVKAGGTAIVDRGTPTVHLNATVPARHGVAAGIAAADRTATTVAQMLGERVAVRTVLRVDPKRGAAVR
jgi:hypothetical protein